MRVNTLVYSVVLFWLIGCTSETPDTSTGTTIPETVELDSETTEESDSQVVETDGEGETVDALNDVEDSLLEDDVIDTAEADIAEDIIDTPDVTPLPEEDPIPEPDITPDFSQCSEPGGKMNIYDIQNPQCPDHFDPEPTEAPGAYIFLEGVVVTAIFSDTIFVQELPGGPYSGLSVYLGALYGGDLKRGDLLDLEGYYYEYFGNTQLTVEEMTVVGQTQPPAPYEVLHPSHVATDGPIAEWFEGVLIRVSDVKTIHTKPDCPNDFNEK